ncbi:MAG TPA: mannonate dehydratase [Spirillospora sp.]|nr:mannonate dehydratase [Spirillospora sp.]
MAQQMRVAIGQYHSATDDYLTFARQLGVGGVQFNIQRATQDLPDDLGYWRLEDLKRLRQRVNDFGLELEAIENVPRHFYLKAMLGLPGRDAQIENYQKIVRHMGEAGIPILGIHWMPNSVWRTPMAAGRGGVRVTAFDMALAEAGQVTNGVVVVAEAEGRTFSAEQMWDNYLYFMERVMPVAEEAGVKIALHPDDPPVPELGGIARIFSGPEGFKKAIELVPSPNHGLDFCMGCFSEMYYADRDSGEGVLDAIRYFGSRGRIFYVHFRDVQGCVPKFQECFLGEGNVDVVEAIRTLKEVGFTGFIIDDHVPHMLDDSQWNHRGRAWSTGYIMALVEAVNKLA